MRRLAQYEASGALATGVTQDGIVDLNCFSSACLVVRWRLRCNGFMDSLLRTSTLVFTGLFLDPHFSS